MNSVNAGQHALTHWLKSVRQKCIDTATATFFSDRFRQISYGIMTSINCARNTNFRSRP